MCAKRWERFTRESANPTLAPTAEAIAQEMQVRDHLRVFGIEMVDDDVEQAIGANEHEGGEGDRLVRSKDGTQTVSHKQLQQEESFRIDLRAVGLL